MNGRYGALLVPLVVAACAPAGTMDGMATAGVVNQEAMASGPALPAGTRIWVAVDQPLGTATPATTNVEVIGNVVSATGETLVPRGALIEVAVTDSRGSLASPPELIGVNPISVEIEGIVFPLVARVVEVDLSIADDDTASPMPGRALFGTPEAMVKGTIIANAAEILKENELGPDPGTVISLGSEAGASLPNGTRMALEVIEDVPLHANIPR